MKKALYPLLLMLMTFLCIACGQKIISVDLLQSTVGFNKSEREEKLPIDCTIILPKDFNNKMPLKEEDNKIWPWFFTEGFKSIFRNVKVIENSKEIEDLPVAEAIIKPELRSWFLGSIPQRSMDQELWNCRVEFKLQFYDMHGFETSSLIVDKNGWGRNRVEALSGALDGFINKLRAELKRSFQ